MSRVNTIGTYMIIVFFITLMFGMIALTSDEIISKNPNLDNKSLEVLAQITTDISNTYTVEQLTLGQDNITANSSFTGTDSFEREFLESKTESNEKEGIVNKIIGVPDLILNSLGIQQPLIITTIKSLFGAFLVIFISLAVYKAWKTGQTD